jgi:hypothetical protein
MLLINMINLFSFNSDANKHSMLKIFYTKAVLFAFLGILFFTLPQSNFAQCDLLANDAPYNGVDSDCDGLDDLNLFMSSYIYMVEGKSTEIFFRNLFISKHPATYTFGVITDLQGTQTTETWSITPTLAMVGEHPFTVQVKDTNGKVFASASSVVRIAPKQTPAGVTAKKLIILGHSLVDQGIMPYYLRQMTDEPVNPTITHHGTRISWSDFLTHHEGKGGSSWNYFAHDTASPLIKNGQINFRAYFDNVICTNCNPDYFVIQLDINDFLVTALLNGTVQQDARDFIDEKYNADVLPIITALRATAPNAKIGICLTPPANDRPNVFLNHFGPLTILKDTFRWKKITNTIYAKYTEYFEGKQNENIFLVPIHLGVDNINHYDDIDPFHPFPAGSALSANNGYLPISKSIYAWLKNMMGTGINNICNLNVEVKNVVCNANNTFDNSADDTFNYDFNVTGLNAGASWNATINAQNITGSMGVDKSFTGISTVNPQVFEVAASNNAACKTTVAVSAPQCSNGTPKVVDLQFKVTVDNQQPGLFTNFKATYTITNNSSVAAEGVWAKVLKPTEIAFPNASPYVASQGFYDWFYSSLWEVGKIPANGTATLKVDFYLLQPTVFPIYGQVYAQVQNDSDSKPANGNGSTPVEDDEGSITMGISACLNDVTPPTIAGCPANIYVLTANNSAPAQWTKPTVTDNCTTSTISFVNTHNPGGSFPLGNTTVTYTATDSANNTAKCTFIVNITQQGTGGGGNFTCTGNVLQNPSFENNLTSWDGSGGVIASDFVSGIKSLSLCTIGSVARQTLAAQAGKQYQLTWKGKTPSTTQTVGVMLKFMSNSWLVLGSEYLDFNSPGVFAAGAILKTAPVGTFWMEVSFNKQNTGCITIDDVCLIEATTNPPTGGTPNCTAVSDLPWEEWISSVKIGSIEKTSSKSPYSNVINAPFALSKTNANAITLQSSWSYFTFDEYWRVWIDYNHDNIFQTTEKAYEGIIAKPANGTTSKTLSSVITVPASALTGTAKMRVVMRRGAYPEACGSIAQGEVEDFLVNISQNLIAGTTRTIEDDGDAPNFILYPNPATNQVNINLKKEQNLVLAKLINQYGQVINTLTSADLTDNSLTFDLATVNDGVYFVELEIKGSRKLVKKLVVTKMD